MTDKEILKLVKEHFTEEWCEEDGNGWVEFSGKPDAFVKFSWEIYGTAADETLQDYHSSF